MASKRKYKLGVGIVDTDEKTLENIEKTDSETGKESIPTHLPHTPILHPRIGVAENKDSMKMAEKRTNERGDNDRQMRTKQSDNAVKVSGKCELEDNETPTENKVKKLNTGNESIPTLLSHTLILNPRGETSNNEEIIKMSETKRTNERDDNDVNTLGHGLELENYEKPDEKSSNESIPKSPSNTFIFIKEEPELREMSEEKATSESRDDDDMTIANFPFGLLNNKNIAKREEITTSESDNESIPTFLSHTPILSPGSGAAENKEVAEKTSASESDEDVGIVSHRWELQNYENPAKEKENTTAETGNEPNPTPLSHTPILHPRIGAAENKDSMKMAEKKRTNERGDNDRQMRTKQSDGAVQVSGKRKLEDNETPTENKVKKLNTGNESIPPPGSHTPILSPGSGEAENKEMAEKERTNEIDDNDINTLGHSLELENNEKPDEKSSNESIPKSPSNTFIFIKEKPELREMSEEKATSDSDDDDMTTASLPCELLNNKNIAKEEEITRSGSDNESIPTSLSHTPILSPRSGAAENKEVAEKARPSESDDDALLIRLTWELQNYEKTAKERENTTSESDNESIPTSLSHTPILSPGWEAAENKEDAEKTSTRESDDVSIVSHRWELQNCKKTAKERENTASESDNESIPTSLSPTPIIFPGCGAAENKEMAEKTSPSESHEDVGIVSHRWELQNYENPAKEKEITTSESDNKSIPTSLSHTPILSPGSGAAENKEVAEKMSTSESDDDVILVSVTWQLQNYKNPANEKENTTTEMGNESVPTSLSPTPILPPGCGAAENKEVAEKMSTSESDEDVIIVSHRWELQKNKKAAKEKENTTSESDNVSIPTSLSHIPILPPRSGAAENKKVAGKMSSSESDDDVIIVSHRWELQNNKNKAKEKENTTSESDNESIPTPLSHNLILPLRGGTPVYKESIQMAEKKQTNQSNDAVKASRKTKLENNETPTKKKEKMLEAVKEFIPTPLSHTPILHPRHGAAENKESFKMAEKKRTNHSDVDKASCKRKLENNETPTKKEEKTLETVKEFFPTPPSHTPIHHPRGTAENKESLKMAEKRRSNHSDVDRASRKRKSENNETPTKMKEKTLETVQEFIPTPLSRTPIRHPRGGAAENKESLKMAEKKRTNQSNDVHKARRKRKLENNETQTKKKEKTSEIVKGSYPTPPTHTPLLRSRGDAAENKARIKRSNQSNDVAKTSCKETLENNEKPAEESDSSLKKLSHNLGCIEKRLVYTDEEDISLEFAEAMLSTSTHSVCGDSGKAGPSRARHGSTLPRISIQFKLAVNQARACYRHRNYTGAMEHLSTALKLCSKGTSVENPLEASADDISSIASFIETKLAMCCLKMKRPSDALTHAHRSISKNPTHFQNHMRQAAAFRRLGRCSEAARSAMIADYMYWLMGGTRKRTSKYIRYYWQAMIEEAITAEMSFTVMYTPFETEEKDRDINKIQRTFARRNPEYLQYKYTDQKALFNTLKGKEAERYWKIIGQKVMSAMDFIRSTKLIDKRCPCSRAVEKLQQASLFGRMQNLKEQAQLLEQVMAEIATIPYLQDLSQEDIQLLELLMADATDTLRGNIDNQRVWNEIQKIGVIEGYLYEVEDNYIKNKARTERRKKVQSLQQTQRPGNAPGSTPGIAPQGTPGRVPGRAERSTPQIPPGRAAGSAPGRAVGSAPGSTPRSPPGRAPGSTLHSPPGRAPGSTPRSPPGRAPGSTLHSPPGRAPGSTPRSPPGRAPGSTPRSPPGRAQGSTPRSPPGRAPGSTPRSPPGRAPQSAPGSTPQSTPRRRPRVIPGSALRKQLQKLLRRTSGSTPGRAPRTAPGRAPRTAPGSTAGIAPQLLSLIRPCSVVLERLRGFPEHT